MENIETVSFKRKLFGGEIEIVVYTPAKEKALEILEEAYAEALRLQKIFNFYDEDSELSELNKKRTLEVSNELLSVIKKSLEFSRITNGKYDVTLGKEITQRKNYKTMQKSRASYKNIEIKGNEITLNHEDVLIDLGSIAKGFITDKISDFLKSRGLKEFMIDSRGDILFSGDYEHIIEIQHPRKKNEKIQTLKIKNQAVATSGDYKQFYGSLENSHIINSKDLISVTVLAPTLEEADAYATALFVATKEERKDLLKKDKDIKVFTVNKELDIEMLNDIKELIYDK